MNPAGYFCTNNDDFDFPDIYVTSGVGDLLKGPKIQQDYFIQWILPRLKSEKTRISRKTGFPAFSVLMNNSMCHNGRKVSEKSPREALTESHTHPTLQASVRVTFGSLEFPSTTRGIESS
jgi:hypothetical protein